MFKPENYNIPQMGNKDFFIPCTTVETACNCNYCCLQPNDTNPTLRATLAFIKTHPVFIDGTLVEVSILLKTSLLTDQDSGPLQPVEVTESTIHGTIKTVCDSYVLVESSNDCPEKQQFTITFDKIIQVVHPAIGQYFNEYVEKLNSLPYFCGEEPSNELNLLVALSETIKEHYLSIDKALVLIIDGIQTANFPVSAYCIIKNLIIVEGFFVIPITKISGFLLNPIC